MMAAGTAACRGLNVVLAEPNAQMGKKLRLTGHGRCNMTNACSVREVLDHVPTNPKFLYSAVTAFPPEDTMEFFRGIGVPSIVEEDDRVFPMSGSAEDTADKLGAWMLAQGVAVRHARIVEILLNEDGAVSGVRTEEGDIPCRAAVLCTGGMSYPATGSTGDGYILARDLGHAIIEPHASQVPLVSHDWVCRALSGLSLRDVALKVLEDGKTVFKDMGDILFSHFGLTGPLILSASAHMRHFDSCTYTLFIDVEPDLDRDELDKFVQEEFRQHPNRDIVNALAGLTSKSLLNVLVKMAGIDPQTKANAISREQRHGFIPLLKAFPISVVGTRPISDGMVTAGGVDVRQVDPRTMGSKLVPGLYFAGEVLDVDAYTGGFNLQIAWSTGRSAGMAVGKDMMRDE